jgi:DHA2 family multidrug resistance protein
MLLMPLVGTLVTRVDNRYLIAFGFGISFLAFYQMSNLDLRIDFQTAMLYRVYQSVGLAFLFVPINTMAYAGIPKEKNGQVSAMANLARNLGGSLGISMVTTTIARRAQFHQDRIASHLTNYDYPVRQTMRGMAGMLAHSGRSRPDAIHQAFARLYGFVQLQSATMAYVDAIWMMALVCLAMVPMVFLMRRNDPSASALPAH